jgi:pyridoxamine 5'-phosphate oxidase
VTDALSRPSSASLDDWLRGRHALTGTAPEWDLDSLPSEPTVLFREWILRADADGVPEPQTATLATVDAEGIPDARTLILKGVDERGWAFAGTRSSRKAAQLGDSPAAALNFWWQPQVRAVRVRGRVEEASADESAADLAARSASARAVIAPGDWARWWIVPRRIEFWQGSRSRRHTRVVYEQTGDGWTHTVILD